MANNTTGQLDKQTWMSKVLDIDTLKLTDIVWPGVHNAGMDKQAPNHAALSANWTICQNDTFAWQLDNGARAFDIRLGYTQTPEPAFYFHHNGFRSRRVLDELIDAVLLFLDRNPDEFIVLDFHQLGDGDKTFDHKKLSDWLVRRLGLRVILPAEGFKTVGELKRASRHRRIVMAAQITAEMDREFFWPRIPHKWHDDTFTDIAELQRHIGRTLKDAPYETFLWSLSATTYSLLGGPGHIKRHINDWFSTTRDWVTRCSIISTDFFDESEIVHYCWSASSMKAVYGSALHEA
ncbi:phospholipase [Pseudomonas sp. PD9R]|uniref:phospholipase n=1 Tax=Pseudomonas sp. PD9R TaxID=2853534 RepID=UPI001C48A5DC|nr:phospholipase [Pseudomonas sp. PD9R]MBV6823054.1 phospholipase [Pseudomonas sp. PD9R]